MSINIPSELVKKLRDITNAGIMDCRKALIKVEGDLEKAQEILRQKGAEKAEKKKDRATNSGKIEAYIHEDGAGVLIELNCETDFVAKNEMFQELSKDIALQTAQTSPKSLEELLAQPFIKDNSKTVEDVLKEVIGTIGENMSVRRFERYTGKLESYIHMSKIGVLVELECADDFDFHTLGKDLAMQIAAQSPKYISKEHIPAEIAEKQKEIITQLAIDDNKKDAKPKPENIVVEKIAPGRYDKWCQSVCLLEQAFIKDQNKTVADVVKEAGKNISVKRFARYALGESLGQEE